MKILFVYPNILRYPGIPVGVASLIAKIKVKSHEYSLFDATFTEDEDLISSFQESVMLSSCDVLAIHCTSCDWKLVQLLLAALDQIPGSKNILKIIGGPHPTAAPNEVISLPSVDIAVVGEGEAVITEILEKLERGHDLCRIQNCWVKYQGNVFQNKVRPLIKNLDKLPVPDWDIFNSQHLFQHNGHRTGLKRIGLETTRGCPYTCTYCMISNIRDMYKDARGKFFRQKSIDRVIMESKKVKEKLGVNFIQFVDDNFINSETRIQELSERYPQEIGIPLFLHTSANAINKSIAKTLRKMGVVRLGIGVETGNEVYRKKLLRKHISNQQIVNAFEFAKAEGIATHAYYMIGLPFETRADIEETIKFNELLNPSSCNVSTYFPFPGTHLYNIILKKGLVQHFDYLPDFYGDSILQLQGFSPLDLRELRLRFSNVVTDLGPFPPRDLKTLAHADIFKYKHRAK